MTPLVAPWGFEFVVRGTPISLQCKDPATKTAWKARVATAAVSQAGPMISTDVVLQITYYYEGYPPRFDVDNIIKPIADALPSIAYENDRQMQAVHCVRLDALAPLSNPTAKVIDALSVAGDFVHVVLTQFAPGDPS